jgi:hypothetical protein
VVLELFQQCADPPQVLDDGAPLHLGGCAVNTG